MFHTVPQNCLLWGFFYVLRALRRVQRSWWSNPRPAISSMQRTLPQMPQYVQLFGSLQMYGQILYTCTCIYYMFDHSVYRSIELEV